MCDGFWRRRPGKAGGGVLEGGDLSVVCVLDAEVIPVGRFWRKTMISGFRV